MRMKVPEWLRLELADRLTRLRNPGRRGPFRRWLNQRPKLAIAFACTAAVVLLVAVLRTGNDSLPRLKPIKKAWFYDLNTGELFVAGDDLVPPIEAPSGPLPDGGPAGVRAYVLTYKPQPDRSQRFIAFLEKADPNAGETGGAARWPAARLIKRIDDKKWVPADGTAGRAILDEAFIPDENGERPWYVRPQ